MKLLQEIKEALLHLAFPHLCAGCGKDFIEPDHYLCLRCHSLLPVTNFHLKSSNPAEKLFWGRIALYQATSQYYFTKDSIMQRIMHQIKYKGYKELGHYMGTLMGIDLASSRLYSTIDALIPIPLHKSRKKLRGYNQAEVLCNGIAEILKKPVIRDAVIRYTRSESQTRKSRIERWQNMEERFKVQKPEKIEGKHVLLIDDVMTTGATLEACGRMILQVPDVQLSLATLCISSGN